jgi:hypothetical protein
MRLCTLPLLAFLVFVPALPAAGDKEKTPTLTLRLAALDDIVADLRYLADQAGRGEESKQFEKLLKSMTGEKGLEGLDPKKPMALYAFLGAQGIDSQGVLMLPIADQKVFLDTLARLNIKPNEDKGLYEVQPQGSPFPVYFRFANGYVYGTLRDKEAVADKNLLKPAAVLPAGEKDTAALSLDLSAFPKDLRDVVIGQLELRLADMKEKKAGETKAQHAFRSAALDDSVGFVKTLLTDSSKFTVRFTIDRQASDVSVSVGLSGKRGSDLAKMLSGLGQVKSTVAGIVAGDSAFASRFTYELPDNLRKSLAPVIDEALTKLLDAHKNEGEKELLKPLLDAMAPSLKQAKIDLAMDFRGPSDKKVYTVVTAAALKEGAGIEKALKSIAAKLPAEAKEKFSLDVAKAGETNIHRLNVEKDLPKETKESLGENPIFFAIRDDGLFVTMGEGGLEAIKEALGVKAKTSPVMSIELSVKRLASVMAAQQKHAPKAAEEAFAKGGDKVFIRLEGGDEFRVRFGMKGAVLRFFALLQKAEQDDK